MTEIGLPAALRGVLGAPAAGSTRRDEPGSGDMLAENDRLCLGAAKEAERGEEEVALTEMPGVLDDRSWPEGTRLEALLGGLMGKDPEAPADAERSAGLEGDDTMRP